jgi:hypothetical protein
MNDGLLAAGPVVIVTGPAARAALDCVAIATRTRRLNGLPNSRIYGALAEALRTAVAASGQSGVREAVAAHPDVMPTIPVDEAATRLGLSHRQTRRLAPRLGGRKIGGRWFFDEQAITEHMEGK